MTRMPIRAVAIAGGVIPARGAPSIAMGRTPHEVRDERCRRDVPRSGL